MMSEEVGRKRGRTKCKGDDLEMKLGDIHRT